MSVLHLMSHILRLFHRSAVDCRLHLCLTTCVLCLHCDDTKRPWEGHDGPAPVLSATPPSNPPLDESASPGSDGPGSPASSSRPPKATDPETPASPVRVGGPWVSCYGSFQVSGAPLKDLTRLSILCGPQNGMRRLSQKTLEGTVAEGQKPYTSTFRAARGACYRIFAVGETTIADLDVAIKSSRGSTLATDGGQDAWPIVYPDRPVCALEDDTLTLEITATKGNGRFAAEVWILPAPE